MCNIIGHLGQTVRLKKRTDDGRWKEDKIGERPLLEQNINKGQKQNNRYSYDKQSQLFKNYRCKEAANLAGQWSHPHDEDLITIIIIAIIIIIIPWCLYNEEVGNLVLVEGGENM